MKALLSSLFIGLALAAPAKKIDEFEFRFSTPHIEAQAGKPAMATVVLDVIVKDGYVHSKSPFKVTVKSDALDLTKKEFVRKESKVGGEDDKARHLEFDVPFTAKKPGAAGIDAELSFYLCTEKVCLLKTAQASTKVDVK